MAAAGANALTDIDWNSPDIDNLLSSLFGSTSSAGQPGTGSTQQHQSLGFPPLQAFNQPSSSSLFTHQAMSAAPASIDPPNTHVSSGSTAAGTMRSHSPEDTFESNSSDESDIDPSHSRSASMSKASTAAAKGSKRKSTGGSATGAAATHGATGVEGKKGRTASKTLATDEDGLAKKGERRKSSSEPKDDSKLKKRKEQNRAAQRAFRERKEKHVKDLEDKVAELLATSDGQKSENENLRDLLARLQKENVMLKQQAFTFSLPSGLNTNSVPTNATKPPSPPSSIKNMTPVSSNNNSSSPESITSSDSPGIQSVQQAPSSSAYSFGSISSESPASLFATMPGPDTPPTSLGFSSDGFNAFTAPTTKDLQPPIKGEASSLPAIFSPPSFAFSPGDFFPPASLDDPIADLANLSQQTTAPPQQQQQEQPQASGSNPYQMIASNPLFTSFRDPGPAFSFDLPAAPVNTANSSSQFSFYNPSTLGSGLPPAINSISTQHISTPSQQHVASPPSSQLTDLFPNGFEDFLKYSASFTNQGLTPGAGDVASSPGLMSMFNYPSSSGDSTSGDNLNMVVSPQSSLTTPPSSTGASPPAGTEDHSQCPKTQEDMVALANRPLETFGSYAYPTEEEKRSAGYVPIWARTDAKEREAFFQNHIMLGADPEAKTVALHKLWEQIQSAPGYSVDSFDVDSLCQEMKCKARCDGNGPVLEEKDAKQILEEVPYRIRANPMFGDWAGK